MPFGSTTGRGFESELAPYLWGAIAVVTLVVWVFFHLQHRKADKDDEDRDGRDT